MIPPEPEPEPPAPVRDAYTYASTSTIPIGSTEGDFYSYIKDLDGDSCYIVVTINDADFNLNHLIVNHVPAFGMTNYYFTNALNSLDKCVLASNASLGGTHPYYVYDSTNDEMVYAGEAHIKTSVPSDYFDVISSGDFDLSLRQTRGDERESDLDND